MIRYAIPALVLVWSQTSLSATQPDLLEQAQACAAQADDARRLSCYDATFGVPPGPPQHISPANPATAVAPPAARPPVTADEQRSATDRFGFRGEIAREEVDRQEASTPKIDMLQARIVAIEWLPRGEFVLTLDNGQVWKQKTTESIGSLKPGDQVTIKAGKLGSFRLSGSSARSTHVQRMK